jgi:outer membrane protein assembly factor BamB
MSKAPQPDPEPRRRRRVLAFCLLAAALLLWALSIGVAAYFVHVSPGRSALDTQLEGVHQPSDAGEPSRRSTPPPTSTRRAGEGPCWPVYGRTAARTSDGGDLRVGVPHRRRWQIRVGIMEFPPSYCDGVLFVNNQHGDTFSVRASTGRVLWRRHTAGMYDSTPAIAGPRVFVGSYEPGDVQALDRATGRRLWRLQTGGRVESSPVVVDGLVYAASADRRVYAIDAETGRVRWAFRTGSEIKHSPSVYKGHVFVGNYAAEVFSLDARTGRERWRRSFGGVLGDRIYASIPVADDTAFVVTVRGNVFALDARTGRTRWETSIPGYAYATPAVSRGRVFVGNYPGDLHAFSASSGRRLWREHLGGSLSGSPTVIGDVVYASSLSARRSWGLDVRTGRQRWRQDGGRYVTGIATGDALYLSLGSHLARWYAR